MKKILIVESNGIVAANLQSRLGNLGDTELACDIEALNSAALQSWDAVVCDAVLGGLSGGDLWSKLSPQEHPVFLYTDKTEVVEGLSWRQSGLAGAFTRTQRGDLLLAVESALESTLNPGAAAPNFLLVEDSPTVRTFVKAVLLQAFPGSQTFEASDGRSALSAMKSSRVSLIVTDLQMPGMDGLSFVQLLRNNSVLKKKPVIVLSGAVTSDARESLSQLDKVQVLAKPATPERLIGAIKSLLG